MKKLILKETKIETPLGEMIAVADEEELCLLEFVEWKGLERFKQKIGCSTEPGVTAPVRSIEKELSLYFEGKLTQFETPIQLFGTPFQRRVWLELRKIPFGETRSYLDIAVAVGKPTAFRAVAQANGANNLAVIIPCHRVINASGEIGGYGGGIWRKKSLLEVEGLRGF